MPVIGPLNVSPENVDDDVTKAAGYSGTNYSEETELYGGGTIASALIIIKKNIKLSGNTTFDDTVSIA
ncbi:hypothetical protein EI555_004376 [Monodon monoceros]|uniref:Uncharacterized protein n=1 Tax=Monodon monoceros TaxID=40151 RepID=A0A4U1F229_MONMO|nr:hypothetical protein EI555_004376 [Monodon monoceros]